jgi:hypothetical protein
MNSRICGYADLLIQMIGFRIDVLTHIRLEFIVVLPQKKVHVGMLNPVNLERDYPKVIDDMSNQK